YIMSVFRTYKIKPSVYRIKIIGDTNVGKFTVLKRILDYSSNARPVEKERLVSYMMPSVSTFALDMPQLNDDHPHVSITMDHSSSLIPAFSLVLFVFDVTNLESYQNFTRWANEFQRYGHRTKMVIIGNKTDLHQSRVVTYQQCCQMALEFSAYHYIESNHNQSSHLLDTLRNIIMDLIMNNTKDPEISLVPRILAPPVLQPHSQGFVPDSLFRSVLFNNVVLRRQVWSFVRDQDRKLGFVPGNNLDALYITSYKGHHKAILNHLNNNNNNDNNDFDKDNYLKTTVFPLTVLHFVRHCKDSDMVVRMLKEMGDQFTAEYSFRIGDESCMNGDEQLIGKLIDQFECRPTIRGIKYAIILGNIGAIKRIMDDERQHFSELNSLMDLAIDHNQLEIHQYIKSVQQRPPHPLYTSSNKSPTSSPSSSLLNVFKRLWNPK
ncbi:hypothetical protein SAMD00019534_118440, partial [Acytostelium subglobosum LB1]|uniref:hypothetical protein n=1 Tax=Acytostelium subglobosum LB1 TaxID=1410327 RepID=UPI0006451099